MEEESLGAVEAALGSLSQGAIRASSTILTTGAVLAAFKALAPKFKGIPKHPAHACAVCIAALASYVVSRHLLSLRRRGAVAALHNLLVHRGGSVALSEADFGAFAATYGGSPAAVASEKARQAYSLILEATLPCPPGAPLKGTEAETLASAQRALGLSPEEAGPLHVDAGRRMLRSRLESALPRSRGSGSRAASEGEASLRRSFAQLVYVSGLLFHDRSYLTPWARALGLSEAQVLLARREAARALFSDRVEARGFLRGERAALEAVQADARALQVVPEDVQAVVERAAQRELDAFAESAVAALREGDAGAAHDALAGAVALNRRLAALLEEEGAGAGVAALEGGADAAEAAPSLPPGVGPAAVSSASQEAREAERRELVRAYLEEAAARAGGAYPAALAHDAAALGLLLGLGLKERASLERAAQERLYRRLLRDEVQSGRLDAAPSPAAALTRLLERSAFDPEAAAALHAELYRSKLEACVGAGALGDADAQELRRLQRLLCLPAALRQELHEQVLGARFEAALDEALLRGRFAPEAPVAAEPVAQSLRDLRLEDASACAHLHQSARRHLAQFVAASRGAADRQVAFRQLRDLVGYYDRVVQPLAEALREASAEGGEGEQAERRGGQAGEDGQEGMPQPWTEITLAKDMHLHDRLELYRSVLRAVSEPPKPKQGEQAEAGFQIPREPSEADLRLLASLGSILGLAPAEVFSIHQEACVARFRERAQAYLGQDEVDEARRETLLGMAREAGLPVDVAESVVETLKLQSLVASLQLAHRMGALSLERIRDVRRGGVDVTKLMSAEMRLALFRQEVSRRLAGGTEPASHYQDLDVQNLLEEVPVELGLDPSRAQQTARTLAEEQKRTTLVQALAYVRQRQPTRAAQYLRSLLACEAVSPSAAPVSWTNPRELADLFAVFCCHEPRNGPREAASRLLGLSEEDAQRLAREGAPARLQRGTEEEVSIF